MQHDKNKDGNILNDFLKKLKHILNESEIKKIKNPDLINEITDNTISIVKNSIEQFINNDNKEKEKLLVVKLYNLSTKNLRILLNKYFSQDSKNFQEFYNIYVIENEDEKKIKYFLEQKLKIISSEMSDTEFKSVLNNFKLFQESNNINSFETLLKNRNIDSFLFYKLLKDYMHQYKHLHTLKNILDFKSFYEQFLLSKYVMAYLKQKNDHNLKIIHKNSLPNYIYKELEMEEISDDIETEGIKILSYNLEKASNMRYEYNISSDFILNVIRLIKQHAKNNQEFITKLADIIVYLNNFSSKLKKTDIYKIVIESNELFLEKIRNFYYNDPEIFINLTQEQKLPNIFNNF
jgi:hypothetical protein